ncbi:MAG TPA: dephospho-CoA kinase [Cyclobacteriaceae bacterium]|nr:dephospho-CoA kinase [Cyclobacteriaceae bacterium]
MSKSLQVGVTGGIGAGKSLICKVFALLGAPVYNADSRAKSIMTTDGILIDAIRKEFGSLSFSEDGSLNTKYLSEHVFNDQTKLELLNSLVHPRVAADYQAWVAAHNESDYTIKEAALLFESGSYRQLDVVILVTAPQQLRIERVLKRDPYRTREQVEQIMSKQMNRQAAEKLANYLIHNDERQLILPQVLSLHKQFSNK